MKMKSVGSLFVHWCTADTIKQFIGAPLPRAAYGHLDQSVAGSILAVVESHSTFTRLQVWYALLYVVIEGYQELDDTDEEIDVLLADTEMVGDLKRFRNAVFHPQENPLSDKLLDFLSRPESENWPRRLNKAFERYFSSRLELPKQVESILRAN